MKEVFEQFLDRTIAKVRADRRFCGLAVAGSWISGEIDEFSDLDLVLVSLDSSYESVFRERFEIAKSLGIQVSSFTGEHVGEPRLLICLFGDPLIHVDLKFVALKDFAERIEDPWVAWEEGASLTQILNQTRARDLETDFQWIEDRFWTWIHYGALRVGRGELFEAIGFLSFLRDRVLGPMALALSGRSPRGVRKIERYLPEFAIQLRKTVPAYDRQSCLDAIHETIQLYRELRARHGDRPLVLSPEAEAESLKYLSSVRS